MKKPGRGQFPGDFAVGVVNMYQTFQLPRAVFGYCWTPHRILHPGTLHLQVPMGIIPSNQGVEIHQNRFDALPFKLSLSE